MGYALLWLENLAAALLLAATLPLFVSIALTRIVERRETGGEASPPAETRQESNFAALFDGAKLVLLSRFLLAAAFVTSARRPRPASSRSSTCAQVASSSRP